MGPYALVLGGGSHLGAIQAAQLLALCDAGITVDYIVGCSVGALNGAYMAAGFDSARGQELAAIWRDVAGDPIFDTGVKRVWSILRQRPSLSRPDKVVSIINRASPVDHIESLPIAFEAVSCNLTRRTVTYHATGDLRLALAASSAIPGLLPPVTIDGEIHVDGGVLDVLPWRRALAQRPTSGIIVLDCHQGGDDQPRIDSALSTLLSSFALARNWRVHEGIDAHSNVIVLPGIDRRGIDTFPSAMAAFEQAYDSARTFIDNGGLTYASVPTRSRLAHWWERRREERVGNA